MFTIFHIRVIGGGIEKGENPVEAMSREFEEEIGVPVQFDKKDYCFSCYEMSGSKSRTTHVFFKVTNDETLFNSALEAFESNRSRHAYLDEVLAVSGMPLYFASDDGDGNAYGIMRYLVNAGGAFSATSKGTNMH